MGKSRKNDPRFKPKRITNRNGVETTVLVLAGPQQTAVARPSLWERTVGAWRASRVVAQRAAAWYRSVGVTPEPRKATAPVSRPKSEREAVRERYQAWLLAKGYDQPGGTDRGGFTPFGGHRDLTADPKKMKHPLTGKPWTPTGFLANGIHARTGTHYDEDDVDARGFMKPNEEGGAHPRGHGYGLRPVAPAAHVGRRGRGDILGEPHRVAHSGG